MWDMLKDAVFYCITFFHDICLDWGLAIIVITVIFRLIITPLMFKQSKATYQMQKIQPLIKQVQERYAGDQVRQSEELQKLYAEAKFNPLASCIPMLIQMPIFILLFQVLRGDGGKYLNNVTDCSFYGIVPNLVESPAGALADGIVAAIPYFALLLLFAVLTFIPSLMTMNKADKAQRQQTLIMMVFMTLMMLFIGWSSPAGVLLFWAVSSLLAIIQQQVSLAIVKKQDAEVEAALPAAPVQVTVERKQSKKRQHKKR